MRIVFITVATLGVFGCAIHKKAEPKKEIVVQKKEVIKQLTHTISDSCKNTINLVKINFGSELCPVFRKYLENNIDSSGKVMYWPWGMDSTFLLSNSKCWIGLTKSELISVLGKPFSASFFADKTTLRYKYIISNNRYNAGSGKYYQYWNFNLIGDIVTLSELHEQKLLVKDKKPQRYKKQ